LAQAIEAQHGIREPDPEPHYQILEQAEPGPVVPNDHRKYTNKGSQIAQQGDVSWLEDSMDAVPGNCYPAGPDEDDADAGKIGPAIVHGCNERQQSGRLSAIFLEAEQMKTFKASDSLF